uniref:DRBM domain-containing protein n=1 Tax=Astyanax mexicanus TaxID=7994 RepID=A0A8B9GU00_ASTMX
SFFCVCLCGFVLQEFILNQDWNDPKSQLQQCCLTLRTEGKEPDIPLYKTLQTVGPSHARTYTVAVYFKGERIGCGKGPRYINTHSFAFAMLLYYNAA